MGREDEIRLIAYGIWEEEGCLDGHDCEHWFRAEVVWEERQKGKIVAESAETEPQRVARQRSKARRRNEKSTRS